MQKQHLEWTQDSRETTFNTYQSFMGVSVLRYNKYYNKYKPEEVDLSPSESVFPSTLVKETEYSYQKGEIHKEFLKVKNILDNDVD